MKRVIALLSFVLLLPAASRAAEVDYVRDIKPLLHHHCYSCHGALKQESNLRVDTVGSILKGGEDGPALLRGDKAHESEMLQRITSTDPKVRMPQESKPLTDEQIAKIKAWIEAGSPAPADEKPETDPRKHWSFQRIERPAVPVVKRADWVRNPIDAFVAAEHEKHGLSPVGEADKAALLRRVTLDLVGLPPTREQLRTFLANPATDAYEQTVDQLLASPAYGERWGRHWMDVWRYSDWYGRRASPDVMNSYPMIWRWRDWIVRSLNEDKGYDRMVTEMLAADEVAPTDDANIVATGFLVRNWYKWDYNTWMQSDVEHTGKAFLGITLNCNHCHDHKYDPITKEEYFKFRAFFEPLELRHDRVPGEADPGPFVKYEYGKSYGPIGTGRIRVFDEKLDATTLMYNGGDARLIVKDKPPIQPGVPAGLGGGALEIKPVALPPTAWYPGLKPFVQEEELTKFRANLAVATATLEVANAKLATAERVWAALRQDPAAEVPRATMSPDVQQTALRRYRRAKLEFKISDLNQRTTEAQLRSLETRIAADKAKFAESGATPDAPQLAKAASKAERTTNVFMAELLLATDAKLLFEEQRTPATTDATKASLAAAEKRVAEKTAALAKASTDWAAESEAYSPISPVYPDHSSGRRTALAKWITGRDNPLAARVAANHIWLRHFGTAIVPSTFDFGRNGKPPTNQALLDWMAAELMEHGWSTKHLHRLIVTSNAYRMTSKVPADSQANLALDVDNAFYWHFNAKRMEAEVVRDSVLFAAGDLNPRIGGPDIPDEQGLASTRRSLYFTHHGEGKMTFLELFDAAEPTDCYKRTDTIIPQQALALANSELTVRSSKTLASRLWGVVCLEKPIPAERSGAFIEAAFEQILNRLPTTAERETCEKYLKRQEQTIRTNGATASAAPGAAGALPIDAEAGAREGLVHVLLNHNDFVTIR